MNASGVYKIENILTGNVYIGSSVSMESRWRGHRYSLRRGDHHSKYLQRSWNKHGERAFRFSVLLICEEKNLIMYEQACIDALQPEYNSLIAAGSPAGVPKSEDTRKKISEALKGRRVSDESRGRMREAAKHKRQPPPLTEESKRKISLAKIGKKRPEFTESHRARISKSKRLFDDETVIQIKTLLRDGYRKDSIAEMFSCSVSMIYKISSGRLYPEVNP